MLEGESLHTPEASVWKQKSTSIKNQFWPSEDKETLKVVSTDCSELEDITVSYSI